MAEPLVVHLKLNVAHDWCSRCSTSSLLLMDVSIVGPLARDNPVAMWMACERCDGLDGHPEVGDRG